MIKIRKLYNYFTFSNRLPIFIRVKQPPFPGKNFLLNYCMYEIWFVKMKTLGWVGGHVFPCTSFYKYCRDKTWFFPFVTFIGSYLFTPCNNIFVTSYVSKSTIFLTTPDCK